MSLNITYADENKEHHQSILLFGDTGVGKTLLAATAPAPLLLNVERGVSCLANTNLTNNVRVPIVNIDSFNDVRAVCNELQKPDNKEKYQTIIIDSISRLVELVLESSKIGKKDVRAAYGETQDVIFPFLWNLRKLPYHIVAIANLGKSEDIYGRTQFSSLIPGDKMSQMLPHPFISILCLRVEGAIDENGKQTSKRFIQTFNDGIYSCKDRSGALDKYEQPNLTNIINKMSGLKSEDKKNAK